MEVEMMFDGFVQKYIDNIHEELLRRGVRLCDIPSLLQKSNFITAISNYPELQMLQSVNKAVDEILYFSGYDRLKREEGEVERYVKKVEEELKKCGIAEDKVLETIGKTHFMSSLEKYPENHLTYTVEETAEQILDFVNHTEMNNG